MIHRLEQLVSEQVRRRPEARAVVDAASLTYGELDRRSNQLANALVARGLSAGDRVCLLVPKSAQAIAALLGILKAGGTYVPLDTKTPAPRLTRMLRTCEPCWLVAHPDCAGVVLQCLGQLPASHAPRLCWFGDPPEGFDGRAELSGAEIDGDDGRAPRPPAGLNELACIIFTSGSTGEPKGVPIRHGDLVQLFSWVVRRFNLGRDDRISCNAPLQFDSSLWDIFGALSSGAELHIVPALNNLFPNRLAAFIRDSGLTQWASVPSALIAMANRGGVSYGDFPELRRLMWYGEVFPTAYVKYWMERLPHVEFTNFYGPTEVTLVSTYHTVESVPDAEGPPIPIGKAVPGRRLAVLDEDGEPAAVGAVGQLCIGGAGLSPGYWRDPVKTGAAFFEMPPGSGERWYRTGDLVRMDAEGVCHFQGRADRQIKLRGYRIELDEVAVALGRLHGLEESAVVAVPTRSFGGIQVCAAYVPSPGAEHSPEVLRRELARVLPSYMVPARWLAMASLPKNRNGKIDHKALERQLAEEE